jgi:Transposase, Mutator family
MARRSATLRREANFIAISGLGRIALRCSLTGCLPARPIPCIWCLGRRPTSKFNGWGSVPGSSAKVAEADGHGMRVMSQSPDPLARMHTMTKRQSKSGTIDIKALLSEDEEFLRALVRTALQEVLEAEMTEALGAEKGERAAGRQGYRSGYYGRTLITRSASWSRGFRRIEPAVSRPSYLNGISDRSGRWWPRWPRCTCKGFRPGK